MPKCKSCGDKVNKGCGLEVDNKLIPYCTRCLNGKITENLDNKCMHIINSQFRIDDLKFRIECNNTCAPGFRVCWEHIDRKNLIIHAKNLLKRIEELEKENKLLKG